MESASLTEVFDVVVAGGGVPAMHLAVEDVDEEQVLRSVVPVRTLA